MNMKIENRNYGKWALISFFTIVILISAVMETLICRGGSEWLYLVLMWIPAMAATVANCISFRENGEPFSVKKLFARGGFRTCRLRYVLLASDPIDRRRLYVGYTTVVSAARFCAVYFPGGRDGDPLRLGIGGNPVHTGKETSNDKNDANGVNEGKSLITRRFLWTTS